MKFDKNGVLGRNGFDEFCIFLPDCICADVKEKLEEFTKKDISENLPGAFIIYKADKNDDEILFANRKFIRFAGCKNMDELLEYTKRSFRNIISVDKREAVIADI